MYHTLHTQDHLGGAILPLFLHTAHVRIYQEHTDNIYRKSKKKCQLCTIVTISIVMKMIDFLEIEPGISKKNNFIQFQRINRKQKILLMNFIMATKNTKTSTDMIAKKGNISDVNNNSEVQIVSVLNPTVPYINNMKVMLKTILTCFQKKILTMSENYIPS